MVESNCTDTDKSSQKRPKLLSKINQCFPIKDVLGNPKRSFDSLSQGKIGLTGEIWLAVIQIGKDLVRLALIQFFSAVNG